MMWKNDMRAARLWPSAWRVGLQRTRRTATVTGPIGSRMNVQATTDDDDDDKVYDQIDFLGNPLVSEVTIPRRITTPTTERSRTTRRRSCRRPRQFVTGFAGRPQALAALLGSVLYPDILVVDARRIQLRPVGCRGRWRTGGVVASSPTTWSTSA